MPGIYCSFSRGTPYILEVRTPHTLAGFFYELLLLGTFCKARNFCDERLITFDDFLQISFEQVPSVPKDVPRSAGLQGDHEKCHLIRCPLQAMRSSFANNEGA